VRSMVVRSPFVEHERFIPFHTELLQVTCCYRLHRRRGPATLCGRWIKRQCSPLTVSVRTTGSSARMLFSPKLRTFHRTEVKESVSSPVLTKS